MNFLILHGNATEPMTGETHIKGKYYSAPLDMDGLVYFDFC